MTELDELLQIAGVPNNAHARSQLENYLEIARAECGLSEQSREVPRELLDDVGKSINKTLKLLERLENYRHWRDICFRTYKCGDGIAVSLSHSEVFFEGKLRLPRKLPLKYEIPRLKPGDTLIAVNAKAVLDELRVALTRGELKPKRGQPEKIDKSACVVHAKSFFDHHSRQQASTHPESAFAKFCELFYGTVTRSAPEPGALAWHIRKALTGKSPRRST